MTAPSDEDEIRDVGGHLLAWRAAPTSPPAPINLDAVKALCVAGCSVTPAGGLQLLAEVERLRVRVADVEMHNQRIEPLRKLVGAANKRAKAAKKVGNERERAWNEECAAHEETKKVLAAKLEEFSETWTIVDGLRANLLAEREAHKKTKAELAAMAEHFRVAEMCAKTAEQNLVGMRRLAARKKREGKT